MFSFFEVIILCWLRAKFPVVLASIIDLGSEREREGWGWRVPPPPALPWPPAAWLLASQSLLAIPSLPECLSSRGHLSSSRPIIGWEAKFWPEPIDQMSEGGTGRLDAAAQAASVRPHGCLAGRLPPCWTFLACGGGGTLGGSRCGAAAAADYSSCRPQPYPVSPPPPLKSRNNKHSQPDVCRRAFRQGWVFHLGGIVWGRLRPPPASGLTALAWKSMVPPCRQWMEATKGNMGNCGPSHFRFPHQLPDGGRRRFHRQPVLLLTKPRQPAGKRARSGWGTPRL